MICKYDIRKTHLKAQSYRRGWAFTCWCKQNGISTKGRDYEIGLNYFSKTESKRPRWYYVPYPYGLYRMLT